MDQPQPESAPRKALTAAMALFAVTRWAALVEMRSARVCSPAMDQAHLATVLSALAVKAVLVEVAVRVKTTAPVSVRQVAKWAVVLARHTRRPKQLSVRAKPIKD